MPLDPQYWTKAVFERASVDADGSAVRAALGSGASSIIRVRELDKDTLPDRMLMALAAGPIGGRSYEMRTLPYTWWLYDGREQGYWRINGQIKLLEQLYHRLWVPHAETFVTNITEERPDDALDLLTRSITLTLYTRG